jgi:hypothetical protein
LAVASTRNGHSSRAPPELTAIRHQHCPPRHAVGQLARGDRQDEHRTELEQADQAEIERLVVDVVDLPADRDRDHLARQVHRQDDEHEQPEVALLNGRRQPAPSGCKHAHRPILPAGASAPPGAARQRR